MNSDELYMRRCIILAKNGKGLVAPNPMVGAVLVDDDKIIGEGYHYEYGKPHAEVNAINNALQNGRTDFSNTTLYVSLEPCTHFGKTPPCVDLIINHNIPRVVIGCTDSFAQVNGKGIEKLKVANIAVSSGLLEQECRQLNKRFFTFHEHRRPFIILKWAQSANGFIAGANNKRIQISNDYTNRLVHKWRSEEAAILIGTNTALTDNPQLTNRYWSGKNPTRLIIDQSLRLPNQLHIFDGKAKTIVFNSQKQIIQENIIYHQISRDGNILQQIIDALFQLTIQSVIVEGGSQLLQSFINENFWDEARIITNNTLSIDNGLAAPVFTNANKISEKNISSDTISFYKNDTYHS